MATKKTLQFYKNENEKLKKKFAELEDENSLLWQMLDDMKASDIQNYKELLDNVRQDIIARSLMITKTKVEA